MEYQKNEDGTDKLDDNGNPIPVITDKDEENDKVIKGLVDELKDLRLQNGIIKDLLEKKNEVPPIEPKTPVTEEEKLEALLDKKLLEREASNAQANKTTAFEKFVTDNKEFHPENDTTGLKRDALKKKFAQFSTDGLKTIDEFYSVIGDAKILLMGNDSKSETSMGTKIPNSHVPTPRNGTPPAKDDELTPKELKLAETTGRTKEQILKLKLKHPDLIRDLLEHVRD